MYVCMYVCSGHCWSAVTGQWQWRSQDFGVGELMVIILHFFDRLTVSLYAARGYMFTYRPNYTFLR